MDEESDPSPPKPEPDSCRAGNTVVSDDKNTSEISDNVQANESKPNNRSETESKNCLNVISNEEKQYDNCSDIVDIYEQESKQQMVNNCATSSNCGQSSTAEVYRNLSPVVDLPTCANAEELLKANEVLSSTFDTSMYSDEDASTFNTANTSQSSPHDDTIADAEACLTRECSVSLPNIDNLLSQTDENGRTDVNQFETDIMSTSFYDPDNARPENEADAKQVPDTYVASVSTQSADDTNWTEQDTEYDDLSFSDFNTSAASSKSNLKRGRDISDTSTPIKKSKKGISFDSVSVYYFPRTQGFTCIPSQGGSTLGMSWNHSHTKKFSLGEHAAEQRRAHKQFCAQQFSNSRNWNEMSTISSDDSDSDEIMSDSEMDYENYNFLQPIPTRERRAMLRASGIQKIDSGEKDECRSIRLSREFCGCTCQVYCDPERCVCAQAGIKCQVDRMNFPCSCTREGCANENGRVEFNPVRVRTHYIHTLMRLEMEKKREEEEQRNRLILNSMESNLASAELSYSNNSSLDELVSGGGTNNLMNFAYHHNDLQSYYSQPTSQTYGDPAATSSSSSSIVNSCFNFTYATGDQFVLPSPAAAAAAAAASIAYHESMSHSNVVRMSNSNEYCCSGDANVNTDSSNHHHHHHHHHQQHEPLTANEYNDDDDDLLMKQRNDQDFVLRDLSNGSDNDGGIVDANRSYASDGHSTSYMQLNENYDQQNTVADTHAAQQTTIDTSVEVSEEIEKEESDSENFGNIIKKTMVESVIA